MVLTNLSLHKFTAVLLVCGFVVLLYAFLVPICVETIVPNILDLREDGILENASEEVVEEGGSNAEVLNDAIKNYIGKDQDQRRLVRVQQRGDYWVLYNYIKSSRSFLAHESITYTTHGDFTFLDNLEPLLERWVGPVSIALYAPGEDFERTIESIRFLRDCTSTLIEEYVTFHIYFKNEHIPTQIPAADELLKNIYDCNILPPHLKILSNETFKSINKLPYPVNIARNIAKESSQTHFVLASDIELYPSPNIIQNFLEMIKNNSGKFGPNPVIFPLNLFEVRKDAQVPNTKTELQKMLTEKTAVTFHKKVCSKCHSTPHYEEWIKEPETDGLNVFYVGKRQTPFEKWEPIYIGTRNDPAYDERLTWEGKSDKMTQGYILCVKDYDMMILDNAFLVHRPGIKVYKNDPERSIYVKETNNFLRKNIMKELTILYGTREGCII